MHALINSSRTRDIVRTAAPIRWGENENGWCWLIDRSPCKLIKMKCVVVVVAAVVAYWIYIKDRICFGHRNPQSLAHCLPHSQRWKVVQGERRWRETFFFGWNFSNNLYLWNLSAHTHAHTSLQASEGHIGGRGAGFVGNKLNPLHELLGRQVNLCINQTQRINKYMYNT